MMPRSLSDCQSLTLYVKIWVSQVIKNCQLCHWGKGSKCQNDTSINSPSSHIVLDFLLHSSSSPLIKFILHSSNNNMFFLRSSSSLRTKYLPFRIRWNINILWHKRDGHLTQSVCSGNKLWREINKALMKKEWRHQFWPQTVISRWNQWISRVLL